MNNEKTQETSSLAAPSFEMMRVLARMELLLEQQVKKIDEQSHNIDTLQKENKTIASNMHKLQEHLKNVGMEINLTINLDGRDFRHLSTRESYNFFDR
jgi:DNA anti-recombination protein RmuC